LNGVRMPVVLIVAAAVGVAAVLLVGNPFAKDPPTKAEIERLIAKRPKEGHVRLVLCNQVFVPSRDPSEKPPVTWTCDTYLGRTLADQRNGPSYLVTVRDDRIASIRQVPAV
jgi:hypothetical protein